MRAPFTYRILILALCALPIGCRFAPDFAKVGGTKLTYKLDASRKVDPEVAAKAMGRRLDPSGMAGIRIRVDRGKMEISVPNGKYHDIAAIRRLATSSDDLKFMLVADDTDTKVLRAVEAASEEAGREIMADEETVGVWYPIGLNEAGEPAAEFAANVLQRQRDNRTEVALKYSKHVVTGSHLSAVARGFDDVNRPAVNFTLSATGSSRMQALTKPNVGRRLAIVFDDQVISAPVIQSEISERGQIMGFFSEAYIEEMVRILKAGPMPFQLLDEPPLVEEVSPE